jgi:hypothetical protein
VGAPIVCMHIKEEKTWHMPNMTWVMTVKTPNLAAESNTHLRWYAVQRNVLPECAWLLPACITPTTSSNRSLVGSLASGRCAGRTLPATGQPGHWS